MTGGNASKVKSTNNGWPSRSTGLIGACSHHGGVVTRKVDKDLPATELAISAQTCDSELQE